MTSGLLGMFIPPKRQTAYPLIGTADSSKGWYNVFSNAKRAFHSSPNTGKGIASDKRFGNYLAFVIFRT